MTRTRKRKAKRSRTRLSKARLDRLVEEAIVDCYNESEQVTGLYTMIEDHLALPFETTVLGVPVTVERVDLTQREEIVVYRSEEHTSELQSRPHLVCRLLLEKKKNTETPKPEL